MTLLDPNTYDDWWMNEDEGFSSDLEETLATHIVVLQARIDALSEPDEHDREHGKECPCWGVRCGCGYDYPLDTCDHHKETAERFAERFEELSETLKESGSRTHCYSCYHHPNNDTKCSSAHNIPECVSAHCPGCSKTR